MLSIRVDVAAALASLQNIRTEQIPFATSRAINKCAFESREALLAKVKTVYKFRTGTSWLRGGGVAGKGWFFIEPGTKTNLTAIVSTDPQYTYLYLYRESGLGGVKRPRVGKYLAVPLGRLKERPGGIPADLRPKALLAGGFGFIVGAGNERFIAVRSKKKGWGLIATGKRYAGLELLYVLIPLVRVQGQKIVDMGAIVKATVERVFPGAFRAEMENAIRTAH
jgi:hypothetical protein